MARVLYKARSCLNASCTIQSCACHACEYQVRATTAFDIARSLKPENHKHETWRSTWRSMHRQGRRACFVQYEAGCCACGQRPKECSCAYVAHSVGRKADRAWPPSEGKMKANVKRLVAAVRTARMCTTHGQVRRRRLHGYWPRLSAAWKRHAATHTLNEWHSRRTRSGVSGTGSHEGESALTRSSWDESLRELPTKPLYCSTEAPDFCRTDPQQRGVLREGGPSPKAKRVAIGEYQRAISPCKWQCHLSPLPSPGSAGCWPILD